MFSIKISFAQIVSWREGILFLYILDAKRSTLATDAVRSENLPSRLHDVPDSKPRREIDRVAVNSCTETEAKRARHSCLALLSMRLLRVVFFP